MQTKILKVKKLKVKKLILGLSTLFVMAFHAQADTCEGYGPQTPRDIDQLHGENARVTSLAPSRTEMNLCNIHFHKNAEHKAKDFSLYASDGDKGIGGGYMCGMSKQLSAAELAPTKNEVCNGLKPGDTIEVHWVHSSADVQPGKTLGACLSAKQINPNLRAETQVFTLVNDKNAMDFDDLGYDDSERNGYHQAKFIPDNTGAPVQFLGSTTGPSYSEEKCSPIDVTWSVRPQCAKLDINSLASWCESNEFSEDHAHGVRKLVTNPALLSTIQ